MTCSSGKEWPIKFGWHAHFQNYRGYFTTGWIVFIVDNELKIDKKLLFTTTSPPSIIVKVLGMAEAMLSDDDKVDKHDYENDTEEEDIVDDEDYKEKDKDDEDDDDDKVVRLTSKNEEHSYQENDSMVLISFDEDKDEDEDDEKLPKS
jgi:hypothetical protein